MKDSTIRTHGVAEWKSLSLFWAHLSCVPLCSETLTSNEGFIYVTVTSLILCFATFRAVKMQDETVLICVLNVVKAKLLSALLTHACTRDYTHTDNPPVQPTHQPFFPCGKLLLITTQSASLVHIAFQECLKHTVPHTVKPTCSICSIQLDIWTKLHCLKPDFCAFTSDNSDLLVGIRINSAFKNWFIKFII